MGVVASFQLRRADRRMAKTLVFVKCAYAGDITRLQEIMTKDKTSPNVQDRFGMTALHWAAYGGKLACVQELIKAGASVEIADANGRNALHHACRKDHDEVVRYLLTDGKIHVNSISESKDTPLHKAVMGKSIRCIEVLLQFGADPNLRNDQNRTPLDELDSEPSVVKDVLPEPIPTARMQEELESWRREFITEVESSGRRTSSLGTLRTPKSKLSVRENDAPKRSFKESGQKYTPSTCATREVENTLITSFRTRISEFSERTSSAGDLSAGSRPSSSHFATKSVWARPSAVGVPDSGSSSASDSTASTGRRESLSGKVAVVPLNLHGLEPAVIRGDGNVALTCDTSRTSQVSLGRAPVGTDPSRKMQRPRNLRYAGKRVIMALRVKKCLSGNEKVEVIRLMLERHMKSLNARPDSVQPIGNPSTGVEKEEPPATETNRELIRATSGVQLSMPPNF